jgi:hypothetical protein
MNVVGSDENENTEPTKPIREAEPVKAADVKSKADVQEKAQVAVIKDKPDYNGKVKRAINRKLGIMYMD